jgi:hypothetical protein
MVFLGCWFYNLHTVQYSIPIDYLLFVPVDYSAEGSTAAGNGGWGFLFHASGRFIKFDVLNFISHPPPPQQRSPL